ncbi:hypothetical protein J5E15_24745, partial [Klebsiella pneumoniae subsp. pneumoniae]|nr:hypothetical protein [Klebsiella pneumoniae subsp. pneumoniae]
KSAQIREILISESAWEEMTCLFAPSLIARGYRIEYIYILLELNHPCSRSCPIIEAVILTDYIIAKHNPGMQ